MIENVFLFLLFFPFLSQSYLLLAFPLSLLHSSLSSYLAFPRSLRRPTLDYRPNDLSGKYDHFNLDRLGLDHVGSPRP